MRFHLIYHLIFFKSDKHQKKKCGGNPFFNFDLQFSWGQLSTSWVLQGIRGPAAVDTTLAGSQSVQIVLTKKTTTYTIHSHLYYAYERLTLRLIVLQCLADWHVLGINEHWALG
jgi:hypothetical protein